MACVASGLCASDAPKNRTDRHTDTSNITLAEYITSHNLTSGINIIKTKYLGVFIDLNAQIGKGYARP